MFLLLTKKCAFDKIITMKAAPARAADWTLKSPLWRHAELWRLWSWCVLSAARKHRMSCDCPVPVRLAPGEAAAPLEVICAQTGLPPQAVRQALTIGKNIGALKVRAGPWGLRIAIVDWQEISRRRLPAAP